MRREYIEEIFEDYLKTPQTQYAILINVTWGSGKTYFFKNNLVVSSDCGVFGSWKLSFHEQSFILAERTQSACISNFA